MLFRKWQFYKWLFKKVQCQSMVALKCQSQNENTTAKNKTQQQITKHNRKKKQHKFKKKKLVIYYWKLNCICAWSWFQHFCCCVLLFVVVFFSFCGCFLFAVVFLFCGRVSLFSLFATVFCDLLLCFTFCNCVFILWLWLVLQGHHRSET